MVLSLSSLHSGFGSETTACGYTVHHKQTFRMCSLTAETRKSVRPGFEEVKKRVFPAADAAAAPADAAATPDPAAANTPVFDIPIEVDGKIQQLKLYRGRVWQILLATSSNAFDPDFLI